MTRFHAWGEVHVLIGILLGLKCLDDHWKFLVAIPLAIASHWVLDDLNIGEKARFYHGVGEGWWFVLSCALRTPVVAGIAWLLWSEPLLMITGLTAWLCFDHEWILNLFGRHGYGLHERMWQKWMYTKWIWIPKFCAIWMLIWLLWG